MTAYADTRMETIQATILQSTSEVACPLVSVDKLRG
jgi:hypothetical protein